jgi:hypothetical protein
MNEPPQDKNRPRLTDRALAEQQARKEREAAALRENLRKRKEQSRARRPDATPETRGDPLGDQGN